MNVYASLAVQRSVELDPFAPPIDQFRLIKRYWANPQFAAKMDDLTHRKAAAVHAMTDAHRDRALLRRDINEIYETMVKELL